MEINNLRMLTAKLCAPARKPYSLLFTEGNKGNEGVRIFMDFPEIIMEINNLGMLTVIIRAPAWKQVFFASSGLVCAASLLLTEGNEGNEGFFRLRFLCYLLSKILHF